MKTLRQFGVCDISDGLVKAGIKDGGYVPNLTLQSARNAVSVGRAYTVLYAPKSDPREEIKQSYIDSLPKDSVLVIGLPLDSQLINLPFTKVNNAMYGGLMSTRAKYLECQGSVILGRIRDLDEHEDLQYPVWSYGVGSSAPTSVLKVVGINVPIEVKLADVDSEYIVKTINPNDIIMGDKNGIVSFSEELLPGLLDYVPKRVEADTKVAEDIKGGRPAKEAQKYWRLRI